MVNAAPTRERGRPARTRENSPFSLYILRALRALRALRVKLPRSLGELSLGDAQALRDNRTPASARLQLRRPTPARAARTGLRYRRLASRRALAVVRADEALGPHAPL